jgi:ketosteroid isomerase-like protein
MSQENVNVVKNLFAAAAAMDKDDLVRALPGLIPQIADPDIEWIEDPARADSRVYRGHAGVLDSWTRWLEQWDEYETEVERVEEAGDDVFVVARERARGESSGATVSSRIYVVISMRDQKITRWREFYEEDAALRAAGLDSSAGPPAG